MRNEKYLMDLLILDDRHTRFLKEVSSLAIFVSNSTVFDPKGLFSTDIFGPTGSTDRLEREGYINLRVPILHPLVYHILTNGRKNKYEDIMAGRKRAIFDKETNDFIIDSKGDTGYNFFIEHLDKLDFLQNSDSKERIYNNRLIEMYGKKSKLLDKFLVMPAGLRDYGIDENGRPTQDEINDIYRRLLIATNNIRNTNITEKNLYQYDVIRHKIQGIALDIFNYVFSLIDGKDKFQQAQWASRAVMNGTRNVITANAEMVTDLDSENKIGINDTVCGIYQYIKSVPNLAMYEIHSKFIMGLLSQFNLTAKVIDSKTLKTTLKTITSKERDVWLTQDGLNNLFNKFMQDYNKNDYAKIGNDYVCLVEDKGKEIYIVKDTNNIPDKVNVNKLRPITYGELVYIAIADSVKKVKCTVTRFPVTGPGSIYPSNIYLKSTIIGRKVKVIMDGQEQILYEYPIPGQKFLSSMSPHYSHLKKLGGDYDGDTTSMHTIATKEAVEEIEKLLNDKNYYLSTDGSLAYTFVTKTLEIVVAHLTA